MAITSDWHIHTKHSCDGACMEYEALVEDAKKLGITDFGVSDHYHSRLQEPDIKASREDYDKTIENHPELKNHFHFGIELSVMSEWEIDKIAKGNYDEPPLWGFRMGGPENTPPVYDITDEFIEKYKIEYVIGGVHWMLYCKSDKESVIKEQHRQYMFCATNPKTDILAHYLWFNPADLKRWPDMEDPCKYHLEISETMRNELVCALKENNVAFELSSGLFLNGHPKTLLDEYLGWVSDMQRSGVKMSMGSDSHARNLREYCDYDKVEQLLKHYKIDSTKFFCL